MPSKLIDPEALPTMSFDWGVIKPLVATDNTDGAAVSLVHVVLLPGQGHERHNHPHGRVPLDGEHGLGAAHAAGDLRARGRRAGAQGAAGLPRAGAGRAARAG